ncbi:HIT domain-containing protein [bacterium]|jgi:diadenosine tetraphosphate (Ap4A) HIT family hydrolase|nr:HIT domain-containing protein [bacterium]
MFTLDPQLQKDTIAIASLPLCELLLMNDANYPWLILVPRREGARELLELSAEDQLQFLAESNAISRLLQTQFSAEKLNIAALGNVVAQLHIHHVARFAGDAVWPKPIWGAMPAVAYQQEALAEVIELIYGSLAMDSGLEVDWSEGEGGVF